MARKPKCPNPREHIEFVPDRPFNDVRYFISSDKLMKLGWKEQGTFEDNLKTTVDWYARVTADYWDVGTDSSLAAHPASKGAHVAPEDIS